MSTSNDGTERRLRTDDEIRALTTSEGEFIWIKNIQTAGDTEFIHAAFTHGKQYHLNVVSAAAMVATENHGELKTEHITTELLDMINTISNDLLSIIDDKACDRWNPDEYSPLARYFTSHYDEWELAKTLIREHSINKYDRLISILDNIKHGGSRALASGII